MGTLRKGKEKIKKRARSQCSRECLGFCKSEESSGTRSTDKVGMHESTDAGDMRMWTPCVWAQESHVCCILLFKGNRLFYSDTETDLEKKKSYTTKGAGNPYSLVNGLTISVLSTKIICFIN